MRNGWAIFGLAVIAFMFALIAPAVTTSPIFVVPTVDQIVSAYDASSIPVGSDGALSGSEATAQPVPSFGQIVGLVAAKSAVVPKQITVIGSRADTLASKGWPGHNVLDVPTWTAKDNIKWLDSAIRRGDEIYLATDPAKHAAMLDSLPTRPFSAFTDLELPYLQWRGYLQDGVRMVPKTP